MVVEVWDHDRFTSDDLLGTVRFPLTDAFQLPADKVCEPLGVCIVRAACPLPDILVHKLLLARCCIAAHRLFI
jgi:hypothetical protein